MPQTPKSRQKSNVIHVAAHTVLKLKPRKSTEKTDLERVKNAYGWSYQNLADQIAAFTGIRRTQDCWRKIAKDETVPNGSTAWAMNEFLVYIASLQKSKAAR
jgi:hypothetical protein